MRPIITSSVPKAKVGDKRAFYWPRDSRLEAHLTHQRFRFTSVMMRRTMALVSAKSGALFELCCCYAYAALCEGEAMKWWVTRMPPLAHWTKIGNLFDSKAGAFSQCQWLKDLALSLSLSRRHLQIVQLRIWKKKGPNGGIITVWHNLRLQELECVTLRIVA